MRAADRRWGVRGRRLCLALGLLGTACGLQPAQAAPRPGGRTPAYRLERAFPGLTFKNPTDLQRAPGVPDRWFVVKQAGRIRSFSVRGTPTEAPVCLDLTDRVVAGGEMGLLGLAFHPRFTERGTLFVNHTTAPPLRTRISRFNACAAPARAPGDEQVLLTIPQPYQNHNGGGLAFGPDGKLYIATGDGG